MESLEDAYPEVIKPWKIKLELEYLNRLLGIEIPNPTQANAVFPVLDPAVTVELQKKFRFYLWNQATGQVRLMCAWDTAPETVDRFAADLRAFELKESDDLEQAGKALVDGLEQNAALLYTLRGGKFALDLTIIAGVGYYTWPPGWPLVLAPLGVSASHQFAELATRGVAEGARRRVRSRRERLVASSLSDPLAAWLADWPSTGGTPFEKLQQVLRRVPEAVRAMEQRVRAKVGETARPEEAPTKPPTP